MKQIKYITSFFTAVASVALYVVAVADFCYVLVIWGWAGGVIQVVEGFKAEPIASNDIGFGIVRFITAAFCAFVSSAIIGFIATLVWNLSDKIRRSANKDSYLEKRKLQELEFG